MKNASIGIANASRIIAIPQIIHTRITSSLESGSIITTTNDHNAARGAKIMAPRPAGANPIMAHNSNRNAGVRGFGGKSKRGWGMERFFGNAKCAPLGLVTRND
jgi:hypothetical protein